MHSVQLPGRLGYSQKTKKNRVLKIREAKTCKRALQRPITVILFATTEVLYEVKHYCLCGVVIGMDSV